MFSDKIAKVVYEKFEKLPKTGKPIKNEEWTTLASIVQESKDSLEVVALGTGTKCLGANAVSCVGDVIADCHGEIIARRSFLKYLYNQVEIYLGDPSSQRSIIVGVHDNRFIINENIRFHFFCSEIPCGDAAIFPKNDYDDLYRTGAKCLPESQLQDSHSAGLDYHVVTAIRTKPGRGDRTLSVSCSDKLLKWSYLGIQGALLSLLLSKPVHLESIVIAGNIPYSYDALDRSLNTRYSNKDTGSILEKHKYRIYQSQLSFQFCHFGSKRPCPTSICWNKTKESPFEVIVNGRKHGVTEANRAKGKAELSICRKQLLAKFRTISESFNQSIFCPSGSHYYDFKENALNYQKSWAFLRLNVFECWPNKRLNPNLNQY